MPKDCHSSNIAAAFPPLQKGYPLGRNTVSPDYRTTASHQKALLLV
jgi:hypothetical protein